MYKQFMDLLIEHGIAIDEDTWGPGAEKLSGDIKDEFTRPAVFAERLGTKIARYSRAAEIETYHGLEDTSAQQIVGQFREFESGK